MISNLDLAVALWIIGGGEPMGDLVFGTEARHLLARKVGLIVGDDGMRNPEVAHNILLEELDNLLTCDFREHHCFHPLSEVVCGQP